MDWGALSTTQPTANFDLTVVTMSLASDRLACGYTDGAIRIWALDRERCLSLGSPLTIRTQVASGLSFSPDGSMLVSCSLLGSIQLWNARTGRPMSELVRSSEDKSIAFVKFSPNGDRIASGGLNSIQLWDAASLKYNTPCSQDLGTHGCTTIQDVLFSPDGKLLVSANGCNMMFWDTNSRRSIREIKGAGYSTMAFSPDGTKVAVFLEHAWRIWVYEAKTGTLVMALQHANDHMRMLVTSLNWVVIEGKEYILAGTGEGDVWTWDVATTKQVGGPVKAHAQNARLVGLSSDATKVITYSTYDSSIRVTPLSLHADPTVGSSYKNTMEPLSFDETDGWVRGSSGELVLWVPPGYRYNLQYSNSIICSKDPIVELDIKELTSGDRWAKLIHSSHVEVMEKGKGKGKGKEKEKPEWV